MENIIPCGAAATHIAAKLFERLDLQNMSLNLDMYERWGHGSDAQLNAILESGEHYRKVSAVEAECRQLLAEADASTRAELAGAFIYMLAEFVKEAQAADYDTNTAQYVARQETQMWQNYINDPATRIDQNCYYLRYAPALKKAFFGL